MITLAVSLPLVLQGTMNNHLMFIFSTYSLTTLRYSWCGSQIFCSFHKFVLKFFCKWLIWQHPSRTMATLRNLLHITPLSPTTSSWNFFRLGYTQPCQFVTLSLLISPKPPFIDPSV